VSGRSGRRPAGRWPGAADTVVTRALPPAPAGSCTAPEGEDLRLEERKLLACPRSR
jgi:hypothetical protein